jgi:hypothetical protein
MALGMQAVFDAITKYRTARFFEPDEIRVNTKTLDALKRSVGFPSLPGCSSMFGIPVVIDDRIPDDIAIPWSNLTDGPWERPKDSPTGDAQRQSEPLTAVSGTAIHQTVLNRAQEPQEPRRTTGGTDEQARRNTRHREGADWRR